MVPLGTPAVAILYILTSRTRFRSWSFYRYRKRFGDLDHCSPGPSVTRIIQSLYYYPASRCSESADRGRIIIQVIPSVKTDDR
jgi:hypothetical protein